MAEENTVQPGDQEESVKTEPTDQELMKANEITFENERYVFQTYTYRRLEDAVAYAEKQGFPGGKPLEKKSEMPVKEQSDQASPDHSQILKTLNIYERKLNKIGSQVSFIYTVVVIQLTISFLLTLFALYSAARYIV